MGRRVHIWCEYAEVKLRIISDKRATVGAINCRAGVIMQQQNCLSKQEQLLVLIHQFSIYLFVENRIYLFANGLAQSVPIDQIEIAVDGIIFGCLI